MEDSASLLQTDNDDSGFFETMGTWSFRIYLIHDRRKHDMVHLPGPEDQDTNNDIRDIRRGKTVDNGKAYMLCVTHILIYFHSGPSAT